MRMRVLLAFSGLMASFGFAQVSEEIKDITLGVTGPVGVQTWFPGQRGTPILFDNGPFITGVGTGAGGADLSVLQFVSLGMTSLGGNQSVPTFRIADDFTIPPGESWDITNITFFGYQTGAPTTSSFTILNFQIWDGPPGVGGSTIVFGDTTTNRLTMTGWSGVFRAADNDLGSTARAIMANEADFTLTLAAGTYWVDWQTDGSLGSGPWQPPITILGQTTTGNAMQANAGVYGPFNDGGTATPQGAPFIVNGTLSCSITDIALAGSSAVVITGDCTSGVDLYCQGPNGLVLIQAGIPIDGSATVNIGFNPDSYYFVALPGDNQPINGLTTAVTVPTLQTWALIAFIALFSIVGLVFLRRNRQAAQA